VLVGHLFIVSCPRYLFVCITVNVVPIPLQPIFEDAQAPVLKYFSGCFFKALCSPGAFLKHCPGYLVKKKNVVICCSSAGPNAKIPAPIIYEHAVNSSH